MPPYGIDLQNTEFSQESNTMNRMFFFNHINELTWPVKSSRKYFIFTPLNSAILLASDVEDESNEQRR